MPEVTSEKRERIFILHYTAHVVHFRHFRIFSSVCLSKDMLNNLVSATFKDTINVNANKNRRNHKVIQFHIV